MLVCSVLSKHILPQYGVVFFAWGKCKIWLTITGQWCSFTGQMLTVHLKAFPPFPTLNHKDQLPTKTWELAAAKLHLGFHPGINSLAWAGCVVPVAWFEDLLHVLPCSTDLGMWWCSFHQGPWGNTEGFNTLQKLKYRLTKCKMFQAARCQLLR